MSFNLFDPTGLIFGSSEDLYGRKPTIPAYPTGQASIAAGIKGNQSNLGAATDLAAGVNKANEDQILGMFRKLYPNYDVSAGNISRVLADETAGKVPQDVVDQLTNQNAAWGVDSGTSGSGQSDLRLARNYGLTGMQIADKGRMGQEAYTKSLRESVMPHFFDVSQSLETPQQALSVGENEYQNQLLREGVAAAPDPAKRGQFDSTMQLLGEVLSIYGGGAGYTGTYQQKSPGGGGGGGSDFGMGWDYNNDYSSGRPVGGWDDNGGGLGGIYA